MKKKKLINIIISMLILFLLSGCYEKKELDDLSYVIAIGVDKAEKDMLKVSFQFAVPIKIGSEDPKGPEETFTTLAVDAPSVYMAVSMANSIVSKQLNMSNNKFILFSEEIAKEGINDLIIEFLCINEIRPRTGIVVCKGEAYEFLNSITPQLENNPARYYDLMITSVSYSGYNVNSEIYEFYIDLLSLSSSPIAIRSEITEAEEESMSIFNSMAVFNGGHLVGTLERDDILAHSIVTGTLSMAYYNLPDIEDKNKNISFLLLQHAKPKVKVKIENNIPKIDITLHVFAKIDSASSDVNFLIPENKSKLSDSLSESLTVNIYSYLNTVSKELKADVAGIGRYAKINYLTYKDFEEIKWLSIFPDSEFKVNVKIYLNNSQIINNVIPEETFGIKNN